MVRGGDRLGAKLVDTPPRALLTRGMGKGSQTRISIMSPARIKGDGPCGADGSEDDWVAGCCLLLLALLLSGIEEELANSTGVGTLDLEFPVLLVVISR